MEDFYRDKDNEPLIRALEPLQTQIDTWDKRLIKGIFFDGTSKEKRFCKNVYKNKL
jgi:hypothetical protein